MKPSIILTAAGIGQRFLDKGYTESKPFIKINGKTLIDHVIDNIPLTLVSNINLVVNYKEDNCATKVKALHNYDLLSDVKYIDVDGFEKESGIRGQAATALYALKRQNIRQDMYNQSPVVVMSIDQFVTLDALKKFLESPEKLYSPTNTLLTFINDDKDDLKWSFCIDGKPSGIVTGLVTGVVEKPTKFVSNIANTGIYMFESAFRLGQLIARDKSLKLGKRNNEHYIAPLYNYLIKENVPVSYCNIKRGEDFFELGTPEDFERNVPILLERGLIQ